MCFLIDVLLKVDPTQAPSSAEQSPLAPIHRSTGSAAQRTPPPADLQEKNMKINDCTLLTVKCNIILQNFRGVFAAYIMQPSGKLRHAVMSCSAKTRLQFLCKMTVEQVAENRIACNQKELLIRTACCWSEQHSLFPHTHTCLHVWPNRPGSIIVRVLSFYQLNVLSKTQTYRSCNVILIPVK